MAYLTIPATKVPVIVEADVVVVGGGPAGVGAALRAAQNGVKTVLIERFGSLGGVNTNGLMSVSAGEPPNGLASELLDSLRVNGHLVDPLEAYPGISSNPLFHYHGPGPSPRGPKKLYAFDPDMAALMMNEMMEEWDVQIMFRSLFVDTEVEDGTIRAVIVENASGKQAIAGKVFVDATGRGDVVARSGAPYAPAGNKDGLPIPSGLMWKMSGVDLEKLFAYQKEDPTLEKLIEKAKAKGELPHYRPYKVGFYGGHYTGHPRPDVCPMLYPGEILLWAHAVHDWGLDCAENAQDLTRAEIHIRKQILSELNFLKKEVPGFENAYLSGIAPFMGIREGRHPIGEYVMRYEDIRNQRKFEDAAIRHSTRDRSAGKDDGRMVIFEIPYRSFLARKVDNLLLAGDNISMEHEALLQIRGFGTAIKLGEVAGTAAGLSVKNNRAPKALNWDTPLP